MLKHLFIKKYKTQAIFLFENTNSWNEFSKKLEQISNELINYQDFLQTLGDGFEVFIEGFIKLTENDNRFGISNYEPVKSNDDYGCDGYGNNIKGEKSAVQIKYRKDPTYYLTASEDNLNSMVAEALHENIFYGEKIPRHYIFTSAKGLNHKSADYKFRDKIKCYGIDDIKSIVDNNPNFWNNIVNLIKK